MTYKYFPRAQESIFNISRFLFYYLKKHGLKLIWPKYQFLNETNYLDFVNKNGLKPNIDKVEATKSISEPCSMKEVRGIHWSQ